MTATAPVTPARGPADPAAGRHAGFAGLLRAEWTKIRSVRSTVWTLVIFVVVCIGFTALIAWLTESNWFGPRAAARDVRVLANPVGFILGAGIGLGQLAIAVLGVLIITSEYSTGVIRASLLAVPRRLPVLAAKAVVFAVLLLVVTEIVAFCSFFVGSAILHAHVPVALGDPGVTRAVIGAGLYLTVLGLLALAIGTMIRHTAGSISTIIGVVFVLPILTSLLPSSWGAHINAYLPEQAGTLITHTHQTARAPRRLSRYPRADAADALDGVAHQIAGPLRRREIGVRGHVDLRQAVEQVPRLVARLDGRPRVQHGVRIQEDAGRPRRLEGQHDPWVPLDVAQLRVPLHMAADEIIAVQPDPDDTHLRAAVGVDRAQVRQRAGLDQVPQLTRQAAHSVIASITGLIVAS